ncbi:response regulator [Pedobacter sp. MC2016-14]|uniref:hybrid sensor histidine kinase/response regulator transcription factor n=1 Tax=Pedobacter sp. MC2016-14 TaxID=2897327 RepID=UPI001E320502|nr:hybrid sensor histidine kinase/response regulator transcription factor [Pedobacter sp. MC2016-14]MCD0487640.1 response regulator [Pedobacter sp. MC2016-14]
MKLSALVKLVILVLLCSLRLQAQLKFKFDYYSTENGLSHDAVTSIMKDREGFLWIGTWNGINRFDGHTFKSYRSFPGDLSQLKNDRIDQITEDLSKNLWIKAYDNQIYRFDKRKEQFYPFLLKESKPGYKVLFNRTQVSRDGVVWLLTFKDGLVIIPDADHQERYTYIKSKAKTGLTLPSDTVKFVHEDRDGKIWVATTKGLTCLLKKPDGKYSALKLDPGIFKAENFNCRAEDKTHIYFGTDDGNLLVYEKLSRYAVRKKISNAALNMLLASKTQGLFYASSSAGELISIFNQAKQVSALTYHKNEKLLSIYEDRSGNLWIEPEKAGVIRYSVADRKFSGFSAKNDEGSSYVGNHYKVFEDKEGRVWVNMKSGGFSYYHAASARMEAFTDQRFSNIITSLLYDDAGVLWFCTIDKGINKVLFQENDFNQHLLAPLLHHTSDNEVRSIWTDGKQQLWLGVKSGNIYVFKNGNKVPVTFLNAPKSGFGGIYCILGDSRGNIWIGSKTTGLYRASPAPQGKNSYVLSHYGKAVEGSSGMNSNEVYALLEDQYGKIWVGTFDEGLNIASYENDAVKFANRENGGLAGYPKEGFRKIRNMALDQKGNVWIGTTNGLVVKQVGDGKQAGKSYAAYSKIPGSKHSLGDNDVQFVFRDRKNRMWLATSGGGLEWAIGNNPLKGLSFRSYTTLDGLPNDYVLSCAEDSHGYIWAATQNGLAKFNPQTAQFKNYDSYDGLPKATFSEASAQQLADGTLVFGTNRGYLSFHADSIKNYKTRANMVLTNLQINNHDQGLSRDGVLRADINYTEQLDLKYNQNIISIDYAILDPKSGPKQFYAYRLKGFESNWNNNREQRRATYTNLPPGKYTFEVKSLNDEMYVERPYKSLEINIMPPPWKTWWAYFIYLLLIAVLIAVARRVTLTMLRLRNKIAVEQKLAELKSGFFTNISHELRTPLTLILNPIEEIGRNEPLSPQGTAQVSIVKKNANRMIRFINQLLDLRKLESGKATLKVSRFDLIAFLHNIFEYFNELALKKNIILELVCDQDELLIWADAEKLDIVIYNLLANAFKFSPDNKTIKIILSVNSPQNELCLEVYDQGKGVVEEKLEEIFGLYYQANEQSDTEQKGTGIGLALSKELVALHSGRISAFVNADKGLSVQVCLPLGKDHFKAEDCGAMNFDDKRPSGILAVDAGLSVLAEEEQLVKNATVLLVEDNTDLRNFLSAQLGRIYQVETAVDGQEGWEKASALMPDLILSDIMMPRMSGIALLEKLKAEVSTSHIPVVLLSAKYAIEHQIEGLQYGADYYITKPFNNEFLFAAIAGLLKQRKLLFNAMVEKKAYVSLEPAAIVITDKDKMFLEKVIEIVEHNMENPDFNIDAVAETIGMGRSTFYRKFKSLTNLAPVEFVRDMRLQRGKQYLDAGETNISVIAYKVGFNNAKYFSTCFREKYNCSPSAYLQEIPK